MSNNQDPWYETTEFESAARFSDGVLRQAGAFARIPPNVLTLSGGLLAIPMILAFQGHLVALGAILFTACSLIDWLDGALARYQQRCHAAGRLDLRSHRRETFRLGPTELGKKIDPFIDKIRYFAALFPLGWNALPHFVIWATLFFALALTFGRVVVEWRWRLMPGANAWGKFKVYAEIIAIALLVFLAAGLPCEVPAQIACIAATALGGVSFLTQTLSVLRQRKTRTL